MSDVSIAILVFALLMGLFYWVTFFYKAKEHPIEVERYLKQDMQGPFAPTQPEDKKTTP